MVMLSLVSCSVALFSPPISLRLHFPPVTVLCSRGSIPASTFRTERPLLVGGLDRGEGGLIFRCSCLSSPIDAVSQMGRSILIHLCPYLYAYSIYFSLKHIRKHLLCVLPAAAYFPFAESLLSLFRDIGFREEETELILANNPDLKSTSLDKIGARVASLQSLKINGFVLQGLVAKSPNLLTSEELDLVIRFLVDELEGRLEPELVERLLAVADTSVLLSFNQKVRLLINHGIPKEKISHVLNKVYLNKLLYQKSVEDIERLISFLEPFGGIGIIARRPVILNSDLDTQLIPRVDFIRNLSGEDDYATGTVLRRLPAILSYSVDHMNSHVEFLKSFAGLTSEQVFKIVHVFPNVISTSKERKLKPRIEFLKECGFDSLGIFKFLSKAPLFLALSEDNLSHKLGFLVKIGYKHGTKELAFAMGAVTRTSSDNMQKVIGLYLSYGLSFEDILAMGTKHPQVLQYNHSSLEEKLEYLIEYMDREIEELLAFPAFLGYKLDSRIKHRYEEKLKIRGENMSLNKLLTVSAERFSKNMDAIEVVCL